MERSITSIADVDAMIFGRGRDVARSASGHVSLFGHKAGDIFYFAVSRHSAYTATLQPKLIHIRCKRLSEALNKTGFNLIKE